MFCHRTQTYSLYFSWLIALLMMLGSLYASEILNWPVCNLCWYQRICIYPLSLMLGIATYRQDTQIIIYAIPLAVLAIVFAGYQYFMQMFPNFFPLHLCGTGPSCLDIPFKWGFITFPLLTIIGCMVMIIFLFMSRCQQKVL